VQNVKCQSIRFSRYSCSHSLSSMQNSTLML